MLGIVMMMRMIDHDDEYNDDDNDDDSDNNGDDDNDSDNQLGTSVGQMRPPTELNRVAAPTLLLDK